MPRQRHPLPLRPHRPPHPTTPGRRMMKYCPPIRRITRGKKHHYEDADGRRVPGVTTILDGGLPKKELIGWAANITAETTLNHWDTLDELRPYIDNYVNFIDT